MLSRRLLIVSLAIVVDPLIVEGYNPLVSTLKTAFNVNLELISLSLAFHMLPLAALSLFSGALSDLYHRPRILMYGLLISCVGSLMGAASPNVTLFLLSRSIQGIGSALIMPIGAALIGDITPKEELGRAFGVSAVVSGLLGVTLGPLVSGFLAGIEWRIVPLLFSLYSLTLAALGWATLKGIMAPSSGKRSPSYILKRISDTARDRSIAALSATGFLSFFTFQGMLPLISDQLSLPPLSLEKAQIGMVFSAVGFTGMLSSLIGGFVADRLGGRRSLVLAFLIMTAPMLLLTQISAYGPYILLLSSLASFNRLAFVSRNALVVGLAPESRGTASSVFNFAGFLGFALAPALLPRVYSSFGMNTIYILNASLLLISAILASTIRTGRE
ncbi:MAG: MFS transporter [Candidatus Bathyarchaeia archaeon]